MGFERFGVVNFASETLASDFVTYLEEGKVMATKCRTCGEVYFPPRMQCTICFSSDIEWFNVGQGKLVTYTTVMYGPLGFENDTPYTLALVEFSGGIPVKGELPYMQHYDECAQCTAHSPNCPLAYKVFGRLDKAIAEDDIKIGMALKAVPITLPEDRISYEFKRA